MKQVHDLVQGLPEWDAFRLNHFGASEAAAMLGISKLTTRDEILRIKKTATSKEFSDWVQVNILDKGHEVEALARPLVEEDIGEDLYPVTMSDGQMSASCDGLTADDSIAFEHKQWNEELAASLRAGVLPDEHQPQCQQIMMVTGSGKVRFVCSNGTRDKFVHLDVYPDAEWQDQIRAGWDMFSSDLAAYVPTAVVARRIDMPVVVLPAVVSARLTVNKDTGEIIIASSVGEFDAKLKAYVAAINQKPQTDQDFVDADEDVKTLRRAEDALESAANVFAGQTADIDAMRAAIAESLAFATKARIALEKIIKFQKDKIRADHAAEGAVKFTDHIAALNERIGRPFMPAVAFFGADFTGAVKGKKTIKGLEDGVDAVLTQARLAANAVADTIQINLTVYNEVGSEFPDLFPDLGSLVLQQRPGFEAIVKMRVSEHREALRVEAEREAQAKAQVEAEAKALAEAQAQFTHATAEVALNQVQDPQPESPMSLAQPVAAGPAVATGTSVTHIGGVAHRPFQPAANDGPPTLRLGQIAERLGFAVTADFLKSLGIESAGKDRAAVLYHEHQFVDVCDALVKHITAARLAKAA